MENDILLDIAGMILCLVLVGISLLLPSGVLAIAGVVLFVVYLIKYHQDKKLLLESLEAPRVV